MDETKVDCGYDANSFCIIERKEGERSTAVVCDVQVGTAKEILKDKLDKWKNVTPDSRMLDVWVEEEKTKEKTHKTMTLPDRPTFVKKNSTMGKWILLYGGAPIVGQKVNVIMKKNNYWEVIV